jgi:hypothetical protein
MDTKRGIEMGRQRRGSGHSPAFEESSTSEEIEQVGTIFVNGDR